METLAVGYNRYIETDDKRCVVGSETIVGLGSFEDYECGDFLPVEGAGFQNGILTEVGPVCGVCLPPYLFAKEEALEILDQADVNALRSGISRRLSDAVFVTDSKQKYARKRVMDVWRTLVKNRDGFEIQRLKDFLLRAVILDEDELEDESPDNGIPVLSAFGCLSEIQRTIKFVQGLFAKLEKLEGIKDVVHLVDAGCGPIPIFALMAALKSLKIKATCYEVNSRSAAIARNIINNLGLQERVKVLHEDATKVRTSKSIDLLISETIYCGLTVEPIVDVLANLAKDLSENGEVVPEYIEVFAGLTASNGKSLKLIDNDGLSNLDLLQRERDTDFVVGPLQVFRYKAGNKKEVIKFRLSLSGLAPGKYHLVLGSRVGVAGEISLEGSDSVITAPEIMDPVIEVAQGAKFVELEYWPGVDREDIKMKIVG